PVEPGGNTLVTRDCHGVTVDAIEKTYGCPAIFFAGAIGGLMGSPSPERHRDEAGEPIRFTDYFHFIRVHGEAVANLANEALASARRLKLTPIAVASGPV